MCPGGKVIAAASEDGGVVTNGMSYSKRNSGKANSGLLVLTKQKIAFLSMLDPYKIGNWSGTLYYIVEILKRNYSIE